MEKKLSNSKIAQSVLVWLGLISLFHLFSSPLGFGSIAIILGGVALVWFKRFLTPSVIYSSLYIAVLINGWIPLPFKVLTEKGYPISSSLAVTIIIAALGLALPFYLLERFLNPVCPWLDPDPSHPKAD